MSVPNAGGSVNRSANKPQVNRAGPSSRTTTATPTQTGSTTPNVTTGDSSATSTSSVAQLDRDVHTTPSNPNSAQNLVATQARVAGGLTDGPSLLGDQNPETQSRHKTEVRDGIEYQVETRPLPSGENQTITRYEDSGTSYTRTEFSSEGVDYNTLRAERNGIVETTATESRRVEGNLEDHASGFKPSETITGERGSTEQVTTRVTSLDTRTEGAEESLVSESTTYRQQIPLGEDPLGQLQRRHVGQPVAHSGREQTEILLERRPDLNIDSKNSGQFLTYTEATEVAGDGSRQTVTEQSSEFRVSGTEQGRDVSYSHNLTTQATNGEPTGGQLVVERQGLETVGDVSNGSGLYGVSEFTDRLGQPDDPMRQRMTINLPSEPGGGPTERVIEFGDYDKPGDGNTLVYRDGNNAEKAGPNLTHQRVTNDGRTLDSQTVFFGTEVTSRTRTEQAENGTFQSETVMRDGDEILSTQTINRELVTPEQMSGQLNPELRQSFLDGQQGGPIFQDTTVLDNREKGTRTQTTAYSSEGNPRSVLNLTDEQGSNLTVFQDTAADTAVMSDATSGDTIRLQGNEISGQVGGQAVTGLTDGSGNPLDMTSEARSQTSALARLNKTLDVVNTDLKIQTPVSAIKVPKSFGANLDRAGVAFAAFGVAGAISDGDAVEAVRSVTGATTSFSSVASQMGLGGPKPAGAGSTFTSPLQSRILRTGAFLSAGLAVYDAARGDYESAAIGGLNAAGLALIAAPEPASSAVGMAIVSGTTIYSMKDAFEGTDFQTHAPFEF